MRKLFAALALASAVFSCLVVPTHVVAKPSRMAVEEFRGDRWLMAQGASADDVARATRCPAPLPRDCRTVRKKKKAKLRLSRRWHPWGVSQSGAAHRSKSALSPLPTETHRKGAQTSAATSAAPPQDTESMDDEQAAAYRVIAHLLAGGKVYVRPVEVERPTIPLVRRTLLQGFFGELDKALAGLHRPQYSLGKADISDRVVNTIAGEARMTRAGVDAVINNMLNRVGTFLYGPSRNLLEVARAPGQYPGYRRATRKHAEFIRSRIRAIASGNVPDNTFGSNEYRAAWYRGPWGRKHAKAPVIGGNRFAFNPRGGIGPYARRQYASAK